MDKYFRGELAYVLGALGLVVVPRTRAQHLTSSPPLRTGIPTAFFKLFILKNHFGGFLLHRRCMLYPFELGMANVSSI